MSLRVGFLVEERDEDVEGVGLEVDVDVVAVVVELLAHVLAVECVLVQLFPVVSLGGGGVGAEPVASVMTVGGWGWSEGVVSISIRDVGGTEDVEKAS